MNQELKLIHPVSVLLNAVRIFIVIGFIVAFLSFYVLPNPTINLTHWWQKVFATVLFTFVYTLIVSMILWMVARMYNSWTQEFERPALFAYNLVTFLPPGLVVFVIVLLGSLGIGLGLLALAVISVAIPLAYSALEMFIGPFKGITFELAQTDQE